MARNRGCKNNPDVFYYIYGEFTKFVNRKKIHNLFDSLHHAYFGIKLGDQGKFCASLIACKTCSEDLWQWKNEKRN